MCTLAQLWGSPVCGVHLCVCVCGLVIVGISRVGGLLIVWNSLCVWHAQSAEFTCVWVWLAPYVEFT